MNTVNRFRAFKVAYLGSTDTKPARIKITDLRYDKSIIVHYTAKGAKNGEDRAIEYLQSIGINIAAKAWAEIKGQIHNYDILLTDNFSTDLKEKPLNTRFKKDWTDEEFKQVEKAITDHFTNWKNQYKYQRNHEEKPRVFLPRTYKELNNILGLAYTSTSAYAGLWACNGGYLYADATHRFTGFAINTDGEVIAIADDENENEIFIKL